MGIAFNKIWDWDKFLGSKDTRIIMAGLSGSGKTTLLYRIKYGDSTQKITIPLIKYSVETIEYNSIIGPLIIDTITHGGSEKVRKLWKHYYEKTNAIIYVVDSNDKGKIDSAAEELFIMLKEECLKGCPLLVYANKQDLPDSFLPDEIEEKMKLKEIKDRAWIVQGTNAIDGKGVIEGLNWIVKEFIKR